MIEIILVVLLSLLVIVLSGIISSAEVAILSISYPRVKELSTAANSKFEQIKADNLVHIKENLKKYISTIVILNNVVNIVGSIYIGVVASRIFGDVYLGLVSGILTFLIIIFSEIIPKILGEKYATTYAPLISTPLIYLTKLLTPIIYLVDKIVHLFIKDTTEYNHVSGGVIREMAVIGKQEGSIDAYESDLIENVIEMSDTQVYEIMVPKSKVVSLDYNSSYDDVVRILKETGYTRFPISKNDEVIGLINAKDLFNFIRKEDDFNISKIMRSIEFAPESMKVVTLEQKLRRNRVHMGAIVNEHGDFVGIVTLEDIFEELLGEIEDEFDPIEEHFKKLDDGAFEIDASMDVEVFNENFPEDIVLEGDYITLNGFILEKLGSIPVKGEKIVLDKGILEVLSASKRKILKLKYTPTN